jgi:hypothetical protein
MLKSILRLLAASTSFVALLLITNSAIATLLVHSALSQAESSVISLNSLNVVNPVLQLVSDQDDNLLHSLSCCCDACAGSTISLNQGTIL